MGGSRKPWVCWPTPWPECTAAANASTGPSCTASGASSCYGRVRPRARARGIAQLRQGLTALKAAGSETYRTYFLALLAEALGKEGQVEEGLGVLAEALALIQETDEGFNAAELHRLRGEFLLQRETTEATSREAEACFRHALTIARQQQARSLELRAAMSLTRLYRKQNRHAEVRPILAECYGWFTEGFDTPDLQEAQALLEPCS